MKKNELSLPMSQKYICLLNLKPHPEGGWYTEQFRSSSSVLIERNNTTVKRSAATSIYFLLENKNFSAWHRQESEETWYYHVGTTPIILHRINKKDELETFTLGNPLKHIESVWQITFSANQWFCASLQKSKKNDYALVSCAVSPGFEFFDFEMGNRDQLIRLFPTHRNKIIQFTRCT